MKIRIALADDNQITLNELENAFLAEPEVELIGSVQNGAAALELLSQQEVDVLVLDLIMPKMDGFAVLDALKKQGSKTRVMVLSAMCNDESISRAVSLGAAYYMVKPFDPQLVVSRTRDLAVQLGLEVSHPAPVYSAKSVDEKIAGMFLTIGIPAHIKGYQFLREAVKQVLSKPDMINRITKELYPTIARKFDTTSSKVERAIRHAIEVAWNRGRIDIINDMFGHCVYTAADKPTNGEFVALIADKLSYDHSA